MDQYQHTVTNPDFITAFPSNLLSVSEYHQLPQTHLVGASGGVTTDSLISKKIFDTLHISEIQLFGSMFFHWDLSHDSLVNSKEFSVLGKVGHISQLPEGLLSLLTKTADKRCLVGGLLQYKVSPASSNLETSYVQYKSDTLLIGKNVYIRKICLFQLQFFI